MASSDPLTQNNDIITNRNYSIDRLKVILSFLVVCIHAPFIWGGIIDDVVKALTSIAVPLFFIISGYFWSYKKRKNHIKKVLCLFLILETGYILLRAYQKVVLHESIVMYFKQLVTAKNIISFLLLNSNHVSEPLWFLTALLYVMVLFSCFEHLKISEKLLMTLIILPSAVQLLIGKYSYFLLGRTFPLSFSRNWLLLGLPFFSVGVYIRNRNHTQSYIGKSISNAIII